MSNVGFATLTIIPSARGFGSALNGQVSGPMAGAGRDAGKKGGLGFVGAFKGLVGPAMALAGGAMFGGFIAEAARASDATDKFKSTMSFAGLDTSAIDKATAASKKYADQTVYDLPTIQSTMAQLASNGIKDFQGLTTAAGNLNSVAGGNAETFKSVGMVMTQTAGAGKLTTENWNQLADAIPGASGPLQDAMRKNGAFTGNFRDAMAAGEITAEEFNAAIAELGNDPVAVEAAKSTKTFEGAIGNLEATITGGLMSALDALKPGITGAINLLSTGLGTAFTAAGTAISNFTGGGGLDGLMAKLAPIGDMISGAFTQLAPVFASLVPQILTLVSSLSPLSLIFQALQPVIPSLIATLTQLGMAVGTILGTAISAVTPIISQLVTILSSTFVAIMPAVNAMLITLGNAFMTLAPVIGQVLTQVGSLVVSLVGSLAPILTQLVSAVMPMVVSIFGSVVNAIGPLITTIMGVLIPVIQALLPVVTTVFSAVAAIVTSVMQIIQGVIQVVTGIISGNWSSVWQGIQNIAQGVWSAIGAIISGAISVVQSVIGAALNIISSLWSGAWSRISSFLSGVWSSITSAVSAGVGNVVSFFSSLPGKILGALGGLAGTLLQAGRDAIQGFINGITGMAGSVISAITSTITNALPDFVKKALGIHSPSRVFMALGKHTADGMALGITKGAKGVQRAADGLVPKAPRIGIPSFAGAAGADGVPLGGTQIVLNGISGDNPNEFADAVLFAHRRVRRGGKYA
ncbi:tape measure protein [Arthrobacter phage VroomVroom]|uniref:Tape measure protein n=1 Tax=Arthrobacter phage VroomVroom TaxID=3049371 RepID=A0AA49FB35_9CAUD|nr:tape measure protein [Arthrobacter phage VroomVroom]